MTEGNDGAQEPFRDAEDEAVEWFVRMRGPDKAAYNEAFRQWLAVSPAHHSAYEWASRHFEASALLKQSPRYSVAKTSARLAARWLIGGGALAAAASIALVLMVHPLRFGDDKKMVTATAQVSSLATKRGEIRTFRLADGTLATLDTDSRLSVAISDSARNVELQRGKARFRVAPEQRPFVVAAGAGSVSTTGATFDVGYDDQRILVRQISGQADVKPMLRSAVYFVPSRRITAGRSLCYRVSDFAEMSVPERRWQINGNAWPSGWAEYRTVPLPVLVEQANRYAATPIVLDSPGASTLNASGRFRLTDTDAFVARIAEVFDLRVSRRPDGFHLSQD